MAIGEFAASNAGDFCSGRCGVLSSGGADGGRGNPRASHPGSRVAPLFLITITISTICNRTIIIILFCCRASKINS